jgi:N-acetylglutamate synthase-like GNAT family acetyltransferase
VSALIQAYVRRTAADGRELLEMVTVQRRGIAAAITPYLTGQAHRSGARAAFLTPAGEDEERIYRRAGFHTVDEIVFISRRVTAS